MISLSTELATGEAKAATSPKIECCMCGDYGLLSQLFQCAVCLFRSQHRYCSNLYPETNAFAVCNWCLNKNKQEITDGTLSSSSTSSSSSSKKKPRDEAKYTKLNLKKKNSFVGVELQIKKTTPADKQLQRNCCDMRIKGMKKQLFKGKVRKYRLLEDVCR